MSHLGALLAVNVVYLVVVLVMFQMAQSKGLISLYFSPSRLPVAFRFVGYTCLILGMALLGVSSSEFIYFQF